jgi:hypothetical protein
MMDQVALAKSRAALHKERAFQASSPKNFTGRLVRPFFLPVAPLRSPRLSRTPSKKDEFWSGAAGKTGTGEHDSGGRSSAPPRSLPPMFHPMCFAARQLPLRHSDVLATPAKAGVSRGGATRPPTGRSQRSQE